MRNYFLSACAALFAWLGCGIAPASAQVLIWSLPNEETTMVKLSGKYRTRLARPNSAEGDLELTWDCELSIKSLSRQTVEIDGQPTVCRWVEFKSVLKPADNLEKPPGPSGTKIYKVLIPENKVIGKLTDTDGIPVTFIPIEKGYRRISDDRPAEPVTEKVLAVYPTIALVTYYADLKPESPQPEDLPLGADVGKAVQAQLNKGSCVLENPTSRSTNEAQLWLSKDVPFGIAKMVVKVTREEKDSTASRDEFKIATETNVDLVVVEIGGKSNPVVSDLPDMK